MNALSRVPGATPHLSRVEIPFGGSRSQGGRALTVAEQKHQWFEKSYWKRDR